MRLAVLGSGSGGNAVLVESGRHRVLLDAGFSCRQLEVRMAALGFDPRTLDAVFLTHEHRDHTVGADVFVRRYGLPVFATEGTLRHARLSDGAARFGRAIYSGRPFEAAGFRVEPFAVPHDAHEPVGFVLEDARGCRLGLAADLGTRSRLAWGRLRELDALILETNHDLQMLRSGPYPWVLKQRVAGRHGHLSNSDAADGLVELLGDRLATVVLYHLSRTNNRPELAAEAVGERLERAGSDVRIVLTRQDRPTDWVTVADSSPPSAEETPS